MKKIKINYDYFNVMRKINNNSEITQRKLASMLGFSLGKLNYCLNALKDKGFVKIKNFNSNPKKIGHSYILTIKGIKEKTKLTINFMKKKMKEYEELKREIEIVNN
jgi:EPS-associated MarR family transcriptional regulator